MAVFGATDLERLRDLKRAAPLATRSDPMTEVAPHAASWRSWDMGQRLDLEFVN